MALASFKSAALELGVELQDDIAADLPAVKGDAAKLRKVFGKGCTPSEALLGEKTFGSLLAAGQSSIGST